MTEVTAERIVPGVGTLQVLDTLPAAIVQRPGRLWNVLARSLGEQGADGRTALAWRWALTGACPSPVTLSPALGWPPGRGEVLAEALAPAELASGKSDPGGQVMHARLVLEWLVGHLDAVPLWNAGPDESRVTDGAPYSPARADIEAAYFWALMARRRYPWPGGSDPEEARRACGWACGVEQLLTWVCGEAPEGPLTAVRTSGRPSLYQVALDTRRAMTALTHARQDGRHLMAGRMEGIMETFLWLAGWNPLPPVDRHGHATLETCAERQAPCRCDSADRCLLAECPACRRDPCAHAFVLGGVQAADVTS